MAQYLSPAVYIEELPSGSKPIQAAGTSTGAFVGLAEKGPVGTAVPIQNFAQFAQVFGGFFDNGYLAFAVKGFFDEGGKDCYVVRTCHYIVTQAPPEQATASQRVLFASDGTGTTQSITVSAASPGVWGDDISVSITHADADDPPDTFSIIVHYRGAEVAVFNDLSMDPASNSYVEAVIEVSNSPWISVSDEIASTSTLSAAQRRPLDTGGSFLSLSGTGATAGNDGLTGLIAEDFLGGPALGNGLHAFDTVEGIRILAMPDAPPEAHVTGMAYCAARGDCFYVADAPETETTADQVLHYKTAQGDYAGENALNSKYGALYAPWVRVFDPRTGYPIPVPPSGLVAGRYAATDASRGVHEAPAGIEKGLLRSVLGLEVELTAVDQEKLNPKGINVIRRFPGVGNVIWGARTVSSDPEWRYLNVRRLFLFLETSIEQSTKWVVFEPNGPPLWNSIVRNLSAFLRLQWLQGALVGATAEEAFYVKCDEETNPQESIDLGRVITEIGVAPSKPAEFVIFRISQFAGGSEASE